MLSDVLSFGDAGWGDEMAYGLSVTLRLSAMTLPIGLALGFMTAFGHLSRFRLLRGLAGGYTVLMRGIPELLTLFVAYTGLGIVLNAVVSAWGGQTVELSPFVAGVIALSLVFGAFAGEVLRGAFQSLCAGQLEAGRAIGMTPRKVFFRIALPQVWRFALPGLGNLWISLVKDTALVSIIALDDLMRMTKVAVATTKLPFSFYLTACLIYWAVCIGSEAVLGQMEKRANRGIRRA
jgi:polar amino acid transport system permease protein